MPWLIDIFPKLATPGTVRTMGVQLSDTSLSVWAKSWPRDGSELTEWLPLWRHLQDAAAVAGRLWDRWLPQNITDLLGNAAGDAQAGRTLIAFLAGVHDIGKATPAFAVQVGTLSDEMRHAGLSMPVFLLKPASMPHGLAGQAILENWLETRFGWSKANARAIGSVVGGHHGIPPSSIEVQKARAPLSMQGSLLPNGELLGVGSWQVTQTDLLEHIARRTGAIEFLEGDAWQKLPRTVLVLALSLVVVADWLASNTDLFPLIPVTDHRPLAQPPSSDDLRLEAAWTSVRFPQPWRATDIRGDVDALFSDRFGLAPDTCARPVQHAAVQAAHDMDPGGILIIEAPMGEGKTEAAMLAAQVLAHRRGSGGVMFALPTQATSDAMFRRLMRWLANEPRAATDNPLVPDGSPEGDVRSVFLAHGKAWLNPDFSAIPRGRPPTDVDRDGEQAGRNKLNPYGGAYVDSWMTGRRKGVLADFVVGTIDQVLFAALQSRHVALRHLAFARKVVILDEVHSFDAYMNVYLERALEWLGAYRVPVVALSATLPRDVRDRLIGAYARGTTDQAKVTSTVTLGGWGRGTTATTRPGAQASGTPEPSPASSVLSYLHDGRTVSKHVAPSARTTTIRIETASDTEVPKLLRAALSSGGCAVIIRNTVKRAQETYKELKTAYGADIVLLHARFLASDRKAREADLVSKLGPPASDGSPGSRPNRLVVVATQVVEQSLDLDFDLLITDLAPTDLLLQRMGRLHRHDRPPGHRPPPVQEARAIVVGVADWNTDPPTPVAGSIAVYGAHLLLRAASQVLERAHAGAIKLPEDIAPLVQQAYGDQDLGPKSWQKAMQQARHQHDSELTERENRAAIFRLPAPDADLYGLTGWLDHNVGDAETGDARAQVRDSDDSFEVLVVQDDGAGQWRLPDWLNDGNAGVLLPESEEPSLRLRRALAGTAVRLPAQLTQGRSGDAVIKQLEAHVRWAWQKAPDLAGQLIMPLNSDGRASLMNWDVRYDPEIGLTAERAT